MSFTIPDDVRHVCEALDEAGYEAYLVGGCIRDLLLGRRPGDWDLATSATPEQVIQVFPRVIPTGIKHGTVTVIHRGKTLEVTTLRGEGAYSDGRHPDEVVFLTEIDKDLARRDFTVNAIAWNPVADTVHDPFGGRDDLAGRVLRAVGTPRDRFEEDGLRVLRAARFCATLEFDVEEPTRRAMAAAAPMLERVSAERKRDEILKMLRAGSPSRGIDIMLSAGIFDHLCPGGAVSEPTLPSTAGRRVDLLAPEPAPRIAAMFLDAEDPPLAITSLKLDKKTRTKAERAILATRSAAGRATPWTDRDARLLAAEHGMEAALDGGRIHRADLLARDLDAAVADWLVASLEEVRRRGDPVSVRDLAVTGAEVIDQLDIPPGPAVGEILEALLRHVLERPEDNRRDLLLRVAEEASRK